MLANLEKIKSNLLSAARHLAFAVVVTAILFIPVTWAELPWLFSLLIAVTYIEAVVLGGLLAMVMVYLAQKRKYTDAYTNPVPSPSTHFEDDDPRDW